MKQKCSLNLLNGKRGYGVVMRKTVLNKDSPTTTPIFYIIYVFIRLSHQTLSSLIFHLPSVTACEVNIRSVYEQKIVCHIDERLIESCLALAADCSKYNR